MRSVQFIMSQDTLQMMCFSYIHSTITYGIILGEIRHIALRCLENKTKQTKKPKNHN